MHQKQVGHERVTIVAYAGAINILGHAQRTFSNAPIYGIVGGLHLAGQNESLVARTVTAMKDFGLEMVIAGHCTGWQAIHTLIGEFGAEVVDPLAVGTRISL